MFERVLTVGLVVGGIGFAGGFIGPMILDPTSGNGPLLGIFITGPIGFVVGCLIGVVIEPFRKKGGKDNQRRLP